MSDQYTEVSEQGFGSSLMESIKGVAVGGLLFLISFPVLWWNEGRTDLSEVAKKAAVVRADAVDNAAAGKLVSVTGVLLSDEQLDDPEFLQPGKYLQIDRVVEMYAWTESKETETKKKLGGGKRKETTYSYEMEWTQHPKASSEFRYPEGHENPSLPVEGQKFTVKQAKLGAYHFAAGDAELPSGAPLRLTRDIIKVATPARAPGGDAADTPADSDKADDGGGDKAAPADDGDDRPQPKAKKKRRHGRRVRVSGPPADRAAAQGAANRRAAALERRRPTSYELANETYLFRGAGTLDRPRIGDVRISFRALAPGKQVTLFGELGSGGEVHAYSKNGDRLFRALEGGREEAIQRLADEHKAVTWVLRIVGFLCMWIGLMLFFGPINAVLDIIPFLGSAGRFLVGLVMLPVSILVSTFVILLSIIAHSTILLVLTLVGILGGGYFLYQKKKAQKLARSAPAPAAGQQWQ